MGVAGVVDRSRFDGAPPLETLTLERWLGAEDVVHGGVGRVGGGDANLCLAGPFGTSCEIVFGEKVGVSFEPVVALGLLTFGVLEARGHMRVRAVQSDDRGTGTSGFS